MDESIRPVMKSKRLLLFKEMLQDAGVKDEGLFGELCTGFRVGDLAPSGQFQQQFKPALGVEQLRQTASWLRKQLLPLAERFYKTARLLKQFGMRQWIKPVLSLATQR